METASKPVLRLQFSQLRQSISLKHRRAANSSIFSKIIGLPLFNAAKIICCYNSIDEEVDTHELIDYSLSEGKTIVLPRVKNNQIKLYTIKTRSECLPGFKDILEPPDSNQEVMPENVNLFFIQAIAFDTYKYRLGYGKGLTDSLLKNVSGVSVGICYTDQLTYELPHEQHDVPMNIILTDTISLF